MNKNDMKTARLPVHAIRGRLIAELDRLGFAVLTAPTGSGKSTQVPQLLLEDRSASAGRIIVLQPRRIAARSLASRVAQETGTRLGGLVGYQVRFDSRCTQETKVVFQTYGVFVQQILSDPHLAGVSAVVLDEFHERTLETDLCLAWLNLLRREFRKDLRLVVMSATIDAEEVAGYFNVRSFQDAIEGTSRDDRVNEGQENVIKVETRNFPVEISYYPPAERERIGDTALRALSDLRASGITGSVLIFMPGLREIRWTVSSLGPYCRQNGLELLELHGSMSLEDQQKALDPKDDKPHVIVATNVAETSLTIPGVTAVIDSGLHRISSYSPDRDINTLYLGRISRRNAEQRAGRAGRTAPGKCVRLWSKSDDASMPASLKPEIERLELSGLRLQAAYLYSELEKKGCVQKGPEWLNPPPVEAWARAGKLLEVLAVIDARGSITAKGKRLIGYPLPPRLSSVLVEAEGLGPEEYETACAMIAILESPAEKRKDKTVDLAEAAEGLRSGEADGFSRETAEIFKQLCSLRHRLPALGSRHPSLQACWLAGYTDRLAARIGGAGQVYQFEDGRKALLPLGSKADMPRLVLCLEIHETGGAGQNRQIVIPVYLACSTELVLAMFSDECAWAEMSEWDEKRQKVVREERLMFRGLSLGARQVKKGKRAGKDDAVLWAEKLASGEIRLASQDEKIDQLGVRIRLARKYYPDYGFPPMEKDDWLLIYGEISQGKNSIGEIEKENLYGLINRYIGAELSGFLEKTFPTRVRMPSGKFGKLTYSESKPPELSARLGDFIAFSSGYSLCEARLKVVFDILAPNYRTVQKTDDLASFWKNTYPNIKKELQRKYPRHPWP